MTHLPDSLQPAPYERTRPAVLARARALLDEAECDVTLEFAAIIIAEDQIVQMSGACSTDGILRAAGLLLCQALDRLHADGNLAAAGACAVAIEALGAKGTPL